MTKILMGAVFSIGVMTSAAAEHHGDMFTDEELSVATFWEQMGPTLENQGIEAYATRYHENFRNWDAITSGGFSNRDNAVASWTRFHETGNHITCTNVIPVTIDIYDDVAFSRLVYEQEDTLSDGTVRYGVWRMVSVFLRSGDTWQALESNMIAVEPEFIVAGDLACLE